MKFLPVIFLFIGQVFFSGFSKADLLSDYLLYPDPAPSGHELMLFNKNQLKASQKGARNRLWFSTTPYYNQDISYYKLKTLPHPQNKASYKVVVLYFTGNAGGAHFGSPWQSLYPVNWDVEEWSFNYPGFGGAEGDAEVKKIPSLAEKAYQITSEYVEGLREMSDKPVIFLISGYSLGSASALYLGSQWNADGLLLYNAPVFPDILHNHVDNAVGGFLKVVASPLIWWMFPTKLKTLKNAERCKKPAVFITGCQDEIASRENQEKLTKHYGGVWERHLIPDMGHQPDAIETSFSREAIRESLKALITPVNR